jgi:hypothetical protein
MEAQREQYRKMFHVDLEKMPELYVQTRIASIQLPSEPGTLSFYQEWPVFEEFARRSTSGTSFHQSIFQISSSWANATWPPRKPEKSP